MFTGPDIVTDGLVLALDAANPKSYPGSGTTWYDISGNGNTGSLINSPTYVVDNFGTFTIDGTNEYFTASGVVTTTSWSAFLWFKYNGQTEFTLKGHRTFFATNTFRYQWDDTSSTTVGRGPFAGFNTDSGGIAYGTMGGSLTPSSLFGKWHLVGMTCDGSTVRNYMNGVEVGSLGASKIFSTNGLLRISLDGISGIGSGDPLYEAGGDTIIGMFTHYNRPLSLTEIIQNYKVQKSRFNL